MKTLITLFIFLAVNSTPQAQSTFRLSELIPENYLQIINEKLATNENAELNNILSNSQFFITNPSTVKLVGDGLVKDYTFQFWSGASWLNDSSVVYAYNQNDLLDEKKIRGWSGFQWVDKYRYLYTYDSSLRLSVLIEQDRSTGLWIDSLKKVRSYNTQGQLANTTTYRWLNSNWENWRLTTSTYNNNLLIQDITQSWTDGNWKNSSRVSYSYDNSNSSANMVFSIWLFDTWINLLQIVISFNTDGLLSEFKIQWWDFISGWVNLSHLIFTYDNNFRLIEGKWQDWDSGTSSWINFSRITSTYNQNNLLHTDLKELWNASNNWVNESFWTYSYDASFNRIQVLTQMWSSGSWENSTRELYNYIVTSVEEFDQAPEDYYLAQNYPNPFNPSTTIKFTIGKSPLPGGDGRGGLVTLKVYDVLGNEIATLVNEEKPAGTYEAEWNATGLPSGVYFYQLKTVPNGRQAEGYVETKKMILMK